MTAAEVNGVIRDRIHESGRVTFAEFMELALYAPGIGYYRRPDRIAAEGDFFTSPTIHPAFGGLIGIQLRQMWELMGHPRPFHVVELGAGSGVLQRDILRYAEALDPRFFSAMRYVACDRAYPGGADRAYPGGAGGARAHAKEAAEAPQGRAPHAGGSVRSHRVEPSERADGRLDNGGRSTGASDEEPSGTPDSPRGLSGVTGCVLSNELLDAFPVHRFQMVDGDPRELYVVEQDGRLAEEPGPPSTPSLAERLADVLPDLPDGFKGEVNLEIHQWAKRVSETLRRGCVLTIDFGYRRRELYAPARRAGTLRCYYRHTLNMNPFQHVGEQDMAAHVDFTAVDEALEAQGFRRGPMTTQREFLSRLGLRSLLNRLRREALSQDELDRDRMALLELIKPEGLGAFKVALHSKGVRGEDLTGFGDSPETPSVPSVWALPIPRWGNDPARVQLWGDRYGHAPGAGRWPTVGA